MIIPDLPYRFVASLQDHEDLKELVGGGDMPQDL